MSYEILNLIIENSAILRILFVFALILFAIKKKLPMGHAFIGGGILLGFLFKMTPLGVLAAIVHAFVDPKTLSLAIVVCMILILSQSLEVSGQMERLIDSFKGMVRSPLINLAIFPALIGLLPMPGGAVFSAPMVKNMGQGQGVSNDQLSYVNYWFRHIWEYWWPLYPGVLLTTALAGIDLWMFVIFSLPLSVVAAFAGYWPLRRSLGQSKRNNPAPAEKKNFKGFFTELFPILLVVVVGIGSGVLISLMFHTVPGNIDKELGLIFALFLSIGWVWKKNALNNGQRWKILKSRELGRMFYLVASILIFKEMLSESSAVAELSEQLLLRHIPLVPIVMVLPFLVGSIAGITIAFVGTTFPILISLIESMSRENLMLPFMMLGLVCGFAGVLLSPLHLCLVLTNSYFKTSLKRLYRQMWFPISSLVIAGGVYFLIFRHILLP